MKRRDWLAIALVFVLFVAVAFIQVIREKPEDANSWDSPGPRGAKGFYMLLEQVGFTVAITAQLTENSGAGILLNPQIFEISAQAESLLEWAEAGNSLIIIGNPYFYYWDNDELADEYADFYEDVDTTDKNSADYFDYAAGDGLIRVIPNKYLCTNEVLRENDNAVRLIGLFRDFAGEKLYILDLSSMAQTSYEAGSVWSAVPSAVWLILIQLGLALYFWQSARTGYWGRPIITEDNDAPAEDEDILALGRLLHEHKQNKAVLAWLYQLFREDVALAIEVGPEEDDQLFMTQAESKHPGDRKDLLLLQSLRQQSSVNDKELLKAEFTMRRMRERWIQTDDRTVINPAAD